MAFTPLPKTAQELTLCWGVQSYVTPEYTNTDAMVRLGAVRPHRVWGWFSTATVW